MKATNNEQHSNLIITRIIELEKDLESQDDFRRINEEQFNAMISLKKLIGDGNWVIFDDFVCAKNAECEYIMNYFYINGLNDGKKLFN